MKYLVLGSAGQIGAPLCDYLREQGNEVLKFDLANGADDDLRESINVNLYKKLEECDFVFFLAFDVGGAKYLSAYQHTFDFIQNNSLIMVNTFEALRKINKPFVFVSSQMANITESSYGALKVLGEHYTKSLGGLSVRLWNVYGPETNLSKFHVITDFILKAIDKKEIEMLTTGDEQRQFLHANDCARCFHILSQRYAELPKDKPIDISTFEWTSIKKIAQLIQENFAQRGTLVTVTSKGLADNTHNSSHYEPNIFIKKYWLPRISLQDGINDMIDFYTIGTDKKIRI